MLRSGCASLILLAPLHLPLGGLVRVDEPSDANNTLGGSDAPTQPTAYAYDALGNLTRVRQGGQLQHGVYTGGQTRTFTYSTLARLSSAQNPESGTVAYEYDAAGNLKQRTDARGLITIYTYDGLHRVTLRDYSDQTPDVTSTYEAAGVTNSKGRLTQVSSSVSAYHYTGYDALGRVTGSAQVMVNGDGTSTTYSLPDYRYDLAGNLVSEQYPSGRMVKTEYDAAGRVAGVKNPATGLYYAGGAAGSAERILYNASGAATSVRLGNGLWEQTDYNSRGQLTRLRLGTAAAASVLRLDYAYGMVADGAPDATRNNGNLRSQTMTVPGAAAPFVQTYDYDELNRLKSGVEQAGATLTWKQVYTYDRYGNRRLDAARTTSPKLTGAKQTALPAVANPSLEPQTNRITEDQDGDGDKEYAYDAAGNLTCDAQHCAPAAAPTPYYAYDGESKLVRAGGGAQVGGSEYHYDGDGRRVKKVAGAVTIVFVYDAAGKLVAEYSDEQRPAQTSSTSYVTQDVLGSTRVVTGRGQEVKGRSDYLPFGKEVSAGTGGRMPTQGYSVADNIRQKFTSYERDNETDLDFAQARYYLNQHGRFTGVDPLLESAEPTLPQSWNRYAYCLNNPLNSVDPTGTVTDFVDYQTGELTHIDDNKDQVITAKTEDIKNFKSVLVHR
ncbi:MAG TPA: RHS repeat-associated core domain-containing protein [Pyrinomonadaceae bacterium]